MTIQGRLWWVEHNVRMALRPEAAASQRQLAVVLLRDMEVFTVTDFRPVQHFATGLVSRAQI